ncbi:MAG: hypothetical protein M1457_12470 [bacterium]|nr:hypothetical protein [bacterium]
MKLQKVACPIILLLMVSAMNAAPADQNPMSVELEGVEPPPPGQFGHLSFRIMARGMQGYLELRCPETLRSSLGLHFIDHHRADMPVLSPIDFPTWRKNGATGAVSYTARTREGVVSAARAIPAADGVAVEYRVRNETGKAINNVAHQMCFVLTKAPQYGKKNDLTNIYTWIGGAFTSLSRTTPTPAQKGRHPWVMVPTARNAAKITGPRENPDGWWMVDQMADEGIIARVSEDGRNLVAIAWDDDPWQVMSNTAIPCLHAGPTVGVTVNLAPGAEHTWRGKIYLLPNDPAALREHYRRDFVGKASTIHPPSGR